MCEPLWWEELQAEKSVVHGKMWRAHPPFTRQTTNTQALLLLGRGLSWLCYTNQHKSAASEMIWERFHMAGSSQATLQMGDGPTGRQGNLYLSRLPKQHFKEDA